MASVRKDVEETAKRLRKRRSSDGGPRAHLEAEIALVSEDLEAQRELHRDQARDLLREECEIDTQLRALDSYLPRIYQVRGRSRDELSKQLSLLSKERRRRDTEHANRVSDLLDRLFSLLSQRDILGGEPE